MKNWKTAIGIISLAIGSGCAQPEVRYITRPLDLPVRPILPGIKPAEFGCLDRDTYRRLVERERLRRNYAEELEAVIRSTQPEQPKP